MNVLMARAHKAKLPTHQIYAGNKIKENAMCERGEIDKPHLNSFSFPLTDTCCLDTAHIRPHHTISRVTTMSDSINRLHFLLQNCLGHTNHVCAGSNGGNHGPRVRLRGHVRVAHKWVGSVATERRQPLCFTNCFAIMRGFLWFESAITTLVRTSLQLRFLDYLQLFFVAVVNCFLREEALYSVQRALQSSVGSQDVAQC